MKVEMNGEVIDLVAGSTLDDLCRLLALPKKSAVISVNGEVVRKSEYGSYVVPDSSKIEVMVFVGGG
ncbi:MAG: sulfur carrier protein ThiS [Deltaproteobacteria bacterium]|nr:sulfur carrier protein ThiS [Deltaproteobacteria bacterium]